MEAALTPAADTTGPAFFGASIMTSRALRTLTVLTATATLCATAATAAIAAPAASAAGQDDGRRMSGVAVAWARAWNGSDPQALGALFTVDGTYSDEAVGATFRGRKEIAGWKARADALIDNVHVTIRTTRLDGDRITVRAVYSGHLKGAPKPFAVPMTTELVLDENHCRIASDQDHYSLATVLAQSGLPADWTPPTT
ncbi:nuclear transport factor 2 family protein [Streptomyces sp. NBC_01439]|uniref:nuclear transport factor 2 family protein n=1 Tax=Streptomyces sp. NBC_01439 TaxID=2903867 RepID=UPI002E2A6142|nr:nuclear transport factor 2 family protein [Streptomyces sp. NBC_01439]